MFDPKDILVDVVALSKNQCQVQIYGHLAYATKENFIARVVNGYSPDAQDICLLTKEVAHSLCRVQNDLNNNGLGLYIYDAYRPLRAVKDFAAWFVEPSGEEELIRKKIHYPNINKTDLAPLGYAPDTISRHNFGNAVDLTLIDLKEFRPLEMGACFDYFDELSHTNITSEEIGEAAYTNRQILSEFMQKHKFIPYEKEFWHFDYHLKEVSEPMDLPIDNTLKSLNVK